VIVVPRDSTHDEILDIVRGWVDELAHQNYVGVFKALGYALGFGESGDACIRRQIENYRSPQLYPGITKFIVTDWRTAKGGNPIPMQCVTFYEPNDQRLVGAVAFDLPLNGQWSDLCADFVFFETSEGYILSLEEIGSRLQW
jgi:hypothetical protein